MDKDNDNVNETDNNNEKDKDKDKDKKKIREQKKAKRYKGLGKNQKRKFTRILRDGSKQQHTTVFNYPQARTDLGLPVNARPRQIESAIATPRPRITLKKYFLLSHKALKKNISYLTKYNNVKDRKISTMLQKNEKLETTIRDLTKKIIAGEEGVELSH